MRFCRSATLHATCIGRPATLFRKMFTDGVETVKARFMRSRRLIRAIEILWSDGPLALATKVVGHAYEGVKNRLLWARFAERRNYYLSVDEIHRKSIVVQAKPRDITIESTTYCNLKCVMCEHSM